MEVLLCILLAAYAIFNFYCFAISDLLNCLLLVDICTDQARKAGVRGLRAAAALTFWFSCHNF